MEKNNKILGLLLFWIFLTPFINSAEKYMPTRISLSAYEVPEWYHDAKIGFFYHWGPQSVVGTKFNKDIFDFHHQKGKYKDSKTAKKVPVGQWGRHMYPSFDKDGNLLPDEKQAASYIIHKKLFGDPKEFGYKDLIPFMSSDGFKPGLIAKMLKAAGVKYLAAQAIHHDGFAMWDSKVVDKFNAAKMGPKANTTKLMIDAARKEGLKAGVSTHAARHSRYYKRIEGYDTGEKKYEQLYGEGVRDDGTSKPESMKKWIALQKELLDTFQLWWQ